MPDGSTSEVENFTFDLPGVSILEVAIDPARHNNRRSRHSNQLRSGDFSHVGTVNVSPGGRGILLRWARTHGRCNSSAFPVPGV
jgi:hypothetical protein